MSNWKITGPPRFVEGAGMVYPVTKGGSRFNAAEEDELKALLAGWQPIETAPKDGSMFICWVSAEIRSDIGGSAEDASEADFCQWRENNGNGYFDNFGGVIGDSQEVTHWMPIAPPSTN